MLKVQWFEGPSGMHFVRLKDGESGEILMVSESYSKEGNAKRAAERLGERIPGAVVEKADK